MYRELPFALDGAVVWTRDARLSPALDRIVPDGCIDLIFSGGGLVVAGPDSAARIVTTPAGIDYVAVRFAPGQGPGVLGAPANLLRDTRVPLDQLWNSRRVRRLTDMIATSQDRPATLASFVRSRLAEAGADPTMREVARRLWHGASLDEVAAAVRLSPRHLRRRSMAAFGYGPKTLARVLRFNRALGLARSGQRPAEVAAVTGYADQAHLAREVRALAGARLGELLGASG